MHKYPIHKSIRVEVEKYVKTLVPSKGKVLDFGGGTGEDLSWLTKDYDVTFLEPSVKMREIAQKKVGKKTSETIYFVDEQLTNFENFNKDSFPHKFDAVLANFAVLNSIEPIFLLSEKLNLVCSDNSDLFFTTLYRFPNLEISHFKNLFLDFYFKVSSYTKSFEINNNGLKHKIYIHSLKHIKKSFEQHFKIVNSFHLKGSYFKIIHLKKIQK